MQYARKYFRAVCITLVLPGMRICANGVHTPTTINHIKRGYHYVQAARKQTRLAPSGQKIPAPEQF